MNPFTSFFLQYTCTNRLCPISQFPQKHNWDLPQEVECHWDCHFHITDRLVASLYSSNKFLVFHPLPSSSPVPPRFLQSSHGLPVTLFLLNSQNKGSLLTTHFLLSSLTSGTNSPSLFSPIFSSRTSRQLFTTTSGHPQSILMISSTPGR